MQIFSREYDTTGEYFKKNIRHKRNKRTLALRLAYDCSSTLKSYFFFLNFNTMTASMQNCNNYTHRIRT